MATRISLLLTKFCGSATKSTARSLIHTKSVFHGYSVCDDPWDPHRPLGIDLDSTFIPLLASGPNLFFESQVSTDGEMETLPIIEITAPIWNPADQHISRPLSTLTRTINCISTASRNIWLDSAIHLFAMSPPLACRTMLSLYDGQILVHDAPTGQLVQE
jgi:hypothetical protein